MEVLPTLSNDTGVKSRTTEYAEMTNNDAEMILQDMEPEKNITSSVSIHQTNGDPNLNSIRKGVYRFSSNWLDRRAIRYYTETTIRYKIENDQPNSFKRKRLYKGLEVSTLNPITSNSFNCKL
jgi:hypothetical protein